MLDYGHDIEPPANLELACLSEGDYLQGWLLDLGAIGANFNLGVVAGHDLIVVGGLVEL